MSTASRSPAIISGVQLKALALSTQPAGSAGSSATARGIRSGRAATPRHVRRVEHERLLGAERQGQRAVRAHLQVGDAQAELDRDIVGSGGELMRHGECDPILLEPPAVVLGQLCRQHPPIAEQRP